MVLLMIFFFLARMFIGVGMTETINRYECKFRTRDILVMIFNCLTARLSMARLSRHQNVNKTI